MLSDGSKAGTLLQVGPHTRSKKSSQAHATSTTSPCSTSEQVLSSIGRVIALIPNVKCQGQISLMIAVNCHECRGWPAIYHALIGQPFPPTLDHPSFEGREVLFLPLRIAQRYVPTTQNSQSPVKNARKLLGCL
jgi:hypothetical protein